MEGSGEFEPLDQRGGKPPEKFAEVGTGGGHGADGVAGQSLQEAAVYSMIALQVSDFRFDHAATPSAPVFRS